MDKPVYVTRFNNETFNQNRRYCETYDGKEWECIYNTPVVFNNKTRENEHIYVLEMNNSINKIVGIGLITQHSYVRKHKMYIDPHYNRYSYEGKYRLDINDCTTEIIDIVTDLEKVIFYTKGHIKRGQGIQCLPVNAYRVCEDICETRDKGLYDYIHELFMSKKMVGTDIHTKNDE